MTEKINLNNLDKSNWQRYRFDQIAKNISERIDPNNTDLNIYVGLEHIDSESLHITRTGTADDVNGQKLRFYPGDIIFGRRRAYQRKAAIATTDGFCSAHALVLRANSDVIDPKLFPFFMHSDQFMHRAVDISVGSLSPTINWGSLKHQEFLLPPKEQQAELAELLWSLDALQESKKKFKSCLDIFLRSYEKSVFFNTSKLNTKKLKDVIIKTLSGGTPDTKNKSFYESGTIPWVTTKKLGEDDYISLGESNVTEEAISRSAAKILPSGNILAGTRVGVGKFAINDVPMSYSQDITGLLIDKNITDLFFLVSQLNSAVFKSKLLPLARGSTIKGITKDDLLMLSITLPDLKTQKEISNKIKSIKLVLKGLESEVCEVIKLNKSLVNQVF